MKNQTWKAAVSAAAIAVGALAANADTITTNGVTWTYTVNDATAKTVTLGNGSAACIATGTSIDASKIPWTFDIDGETYTVTALANNAFKSCSNLSGTLTIPNAVTSMGQQAFYGCPKLSRLASLGSIAHIRFEAFRGSYGMGSAGYPDMSNVQTISTNAFYWSNMSGMLRLDGLAGEMGSTGAFTEYDTNGGYLKNVILSRNPFRMSGRNIFLNSVKLGSVFMPGPDSEGVSLITVCNTFYACTSLKVFLAGPRTGIDTTDMPWRNMFTHGTTECRVFVPANNGAVSGVRNAASWDAYEGNDWAAGNTVLFYGPGRELDFAFDHDSKKITATTTTAFAFTNVLAAVATFKDVFGYSTKVSVANAIEVESGTVTSEMAEGAIFGVTTQAALNSVLAAVPSEVPIYIDPAGARENLFVTTENRKVWVLLPANGSYKVRQGGLVIIVK